MECGEDDGESVVAGDDGEVGEEGAVAPARYTRDSCSGSSQIAASGMCSTIWTVVALDDATLGRCDGTELPLPMLQEHGGTDGERTRRSIHSLSEVELRNAVRGAAVQA